MISQVFLVRLKMVLWSYQKREKWHRKSDLVSIFSFLGKWFVVGLDPAPLSVPRLLSIFSLVSLLFSSARLVLFLLDATVHEPGSHTHQPPAAVEGGFTCLVFCLVCSGLVFACRPLYKIVNCVLHVLMALFLLCACPRNIHDRIDGTDSPFF